ncbi:hypothetical protein [Rhodopirellula bahusiensis]|uniref:AIM24 family protein n=1 Tax=Rhodopirellula bahusiensis TaxID=2014065 RepID=A0A2G1VXI4_9BACT|nr:hypothetical protein [Rhodopirellula bahusiensis]PHQ31487.1 hypothetical protein CEE69_30775 [Rhodopirellula bahusiensis]
MKPVVETQDHFVVCEEKKGWICEEVLQSGKRLEHSFPQPTKSLVARLLSGKLLMKEVPAGTNATIAAPQGKRLIRVEIQDKQIVGTRVSKIMGLIGATFDGGRVSASLTAFSVGQSIVHTVSGPGTIYFQAESRSTKVLTESSVGEESFDPRSIVCFGAGSEFVITSGRNFWSLFAGTWQLELKSGWVVIDTGHGTSRGSGLGTMLKRAYLPWT